MNAVKATYTRTKNPTSTGMARSSPGQCTPAPSPTQNTPKLVNMTPTAVLIVFSGTSLSWRATMRPTTADEDGRCGRGERGQAEPVLGRAEADHDQHHLGALEEDALERHREADAVASFASPRPFADDCAAACSSSSA